MIGNQSLPARRRSFGLLGGQALRGLDTGSRALIWHGHVVALCSGEGAGRHGALWERHGEDAAGKFLGRRPLRGPRSCRFAIEPRALRASRPCGRRSLTRLCGRS
jgi:hypothetical protein